MLKKRNGSKITEFIEEGISTKRQLLQQAEMVYIFKYIN